MTIQSELNRLMGARRKPARPGSRRHGGISAARLRAHPRVQFVDGRDQGFEDWFIYLQPGWHYAGDPGSHAYGFTTLREALAAAETAQPCDCDECEREKESAR
jgi:hypothetical protein